MPAYKYLNGSTLISLFNGNIVSIKTLAESYDLKLAFTFTMDSNGLIIPGKVVCVWQTGTKSTVKVELNNEEFFICTPSHEVMLANGLYKRVEDLKYKDVLMSVDRGRLRAISIADFETQDVYAMTVNKYNNFALSAGAFVQGC